MNIELKFYILSKQEVPEFGKIEFFPDIYYVSDSIEKVLKTFSFEFEKITDKLYKYSKYYSMDRCEVIYELREIEVINCIGNE